MLASTTALSLLGQNTAWAVCADGSSLPAKGFVIGKAPVKQANNFSKGVFTGTAGSLFIPDTSVNENNDPTKPLTGGGHNWVFDQGSTLCKVTDTGPAGAVAKNWSIPPNTPTECVLLPIIKGGVVTNIGDIPYQGQVITPTCDPTILASAANTRFNQLGCAISHSAPTTPQTATSFLFVAGIKGGLFSVRLDNVFTPVVGGSAGKTVGPQDYYSAIPEGQKLTNGAVSPDGQFAMATSLRHGGTSVFACLNPLGDPGDPTQAIDPNFTIPQASQVKCMQVGNNALAADLTTEFGPDNQPYFGGQRVVNTFTNDPGSTASRAAWPNCLWQNNGSTSLADAFAHGRANGCGNAVPNFAFSSALITQPSAIATHVTATGDQYLYTAPVGGTVVQFKLGKNLDGTTKYAFRTYLTGTTLVTGLGVADDLGSLIVMGDPTGIGAAGQEEMTQTPLCEDMP